MHSKNVFSVCHDNESFPLLCQDPGLLILSPQGTEGSNQ